ncbi:MFS transporter [Caulobacter sp. CCUG 60055]|uniref:MFS transporter n=1 Tax=Caulobacter sp. CCUG 60055 TaxID=2100090 RepID=UPI001FA74E02|nr:MFS transporter [Caulobacter sp. CCUG 60055]MBQ1540905.1 MFS transporter [Caulobacteraceae bacterium]MCI3179187.1 MFS transporter [Caulobacter sp. CCUG 60055]
MSNIADAELEAWRPPRLASAAALFMGVAALLGAGVQPILFGAMSDAHRISAAQIGEAAMLELFVMGVAAAGAGALFKPHHMRLFGVAAALALAAANLATMHAAGAAILLIRGLAGLPSGVLLWITISLIGRQASPERWAGVFFTVLTVLQLTVAVIMAKLIAPRLGVEGGFGFLAAGAGLAALIALLVPHRYPPLAHEGGVEGLPPPRGWIALLATLIYTGAGVAVWVYMASLAHQSGLGPEVIAIAAPASLGVQILGAAAATLVAERITYVAAFVVSGLVCLGAYAVLAMEPSAAVFVACVAATGFVGMFVSPYLVPLAIEADPSRRAAMLSGGAQLLGSSLGPLAASFVVNDRDAHGALGMAATWIVVGVAIIVGLHATRLRRAPSPA